MSQNAMFTQSKWPRWHRHCVSVVPIVNGKQLMLVQLTQMYLWKLEVSTVQEKRQFVSAHRLFKNGIDFFWRGFQFQFGIQCRRAFIGATNLEFLIHWQSILHKGEISGIFPFHWIHHPSFLWRVTFYIFVGYLDIQKGDSNSVTRRLDYFFEIWPFATMKINSKAQEICQSRL